MIGMIIDYGASNESIPIVNIAIANYSISNYS